MNGQQVTATEFYQVIGMLTMEKVFLQTKLTQQQNVITTQAKEIADLLAQVEDLEETQAKVPADNELEKIDN